MTIVVVGTRGFPNVQGGVEKHCEELYARLAALGCDVTVLSRAPYTGSTPYRHRGVLVLPLPCPKHKYLEAFLHTFVGILKAKQLKADIVHVHAVGPSMFAPLARLLGMKVVMTHHGPDYERAKWNGFAKAVLRMGERLGVTFADEVIAISHVIAREIRDAFGRDATVIPNGVVAAERAEHDDALRRYGLERGNYVLAVGRLVPEKGFGELVESFHQASSAERGVWRRRKLVIVGDADHDDTFSREFKRRSHGLPEVVLTGFQSGKPLQELYSHAGLFVLPSFHEGLPIALLEALSYGSSCLVSDIPANREVGLEDERYFTPGDVGAMTRKLKEFLDRSDTDAECSSRIQQVIEKYNWSDITQRTFQVYRDVLQPRAARRPWIPPVAEASIDLTLTEG